MAVVTQYWLIKSEPSVYSMSDLKRDAKTSWDCVRNYQARNHLQQMAVGDLALFYHSNADPIGIAGVAKVIKVTYPDPTQFDSSSDYFDGKATPEKPRWFSVGVACDQMFKAVVTRERLKSQKILADMVLFKNGRLSVQPVTEREFNAIRKLGTQG